MLKHLLYFSLFFSFLVLSFSGTLCLLSKANSFTLTELTSNLGEEEDGTEKDTKSESDEFYDTLNLAFYTNTNQVNKFHAYILAYFALVEYVIFTPPPEL